MLGSTAGAPHVGPFLRRRHALPLAQLLCAGALCQKALGIGQLFSLKPLQLKVVIMSARVLVNCSASSLEAAFAAGHGL